MTLKDLLFAYGTQASPSKQERFEQEEEEEVWLQSMSEFDAADAQNRAPRGAPVEPPIVPQSFVQREGRLWPHADGTRLPLDLQERLAIWSAAHRAQGADARWAAARRRGISDAGLFARLVDEAGTGGANTVFAADASGRPVRVALGVRVEHPFRVRIGASSSGREVPPARVLVLAREVLKIPLPR